MTIEWDYVHEYVSNTEEILLFAGLAMSNAEIAAACGVSHMTVHRWKTEGKADWKYAPALEKLVVPTARWFGKHIPSMRKAVLANFPDPIMGEHESKRKMGRPSKRGRPRKGIDYNPIMFRYQDSDGNLLDKDRKVIGHVSQLKNYKH